MKLKEKLIVITGAGQGLGLAMAKKLSEKGTSLALVDMNESALEQTKSDCLEAGAPDAYTYVADVSKEDQVESLFENIANDFGRINGLINNAGILRDGLLVKAEDGHVVKKLSMQAWQSVIDVNLTGVFLCAREAAVRMIETKSEGAIINISSISRAGNFGQTNYSAAKAGVAAMTVTWAKELAKYGIRVNGIAPGFIETEMTAQMPAAAIKRAESQIPAGRLGSADEIAKTVLFILKNQYINGRTLEVDGGARL